MADGTQTNLTGQMLIAMPGMGDPRFERSVVYMCAHNSDGAMGLIVNKPAQDIAFKDLLSQLDIQAPPQNKEIRVLFGGPVENGRGFVLHSNDYVSNESTLNVTGTIGMTATLDILEDIAHGRGPSTSVLALGYAGWGPGQLESEIVQNGWLTCDASDGLIFGEDATEGKWIAAIKSLGIDPLMLSALGGTA
ncbi:YqgE/AlgH family protein [Shimia ponticola]|uniref:YqgE/AlgH family protein n=1 Tax=Shimia ponticola TaxID=2582893 RepID=UPI0011BF0051|nr:YqgE/AlgH family protein [Shimia ponticola]